MFNRFGIDELFERTIISSLLYGFINIRTVNKLYEADVELLFPMTALNFIRSLRDQDLYTLFLVKLNIYLFGSIQNLIKLLDRLAGYNFNFNIDKFLVDLIYKTEFRKRYSAEENLEIKTINNSFFFEIEEVNREKIATKISIKNTENTALNNGQSLDVLKHFLNKIKQLTGIA